MLHRYRSAHRVGIDVSVPIAGAPGLSSISASFIDSRPGSSGPNQIQPGRLDLILQTNLRFIGPPPDKWLLRSGGGRGHAGGTEIAVPGRERTTAEAARRRH